MPVTVDARGDQAEFRVVCQPCLESYRGELPTDLTVAQGASYDFLNIGTLPNGYKYRIEFTLNDAEEQVELKIYRLPKPPPAKLMGYARPAAKKEKVLCLGPFPVHVQPGTRCLVIQQSTDEIDQQIATAMEDYRDDSDRDDIDRDETYRDDIDGDDSEGDGNYCDDDNGGDNYRDDTDNEVLPASPRPGPSSGLGNSSHDPGPTSGSSSSHGQGYTSGGDDKAR